MTDLVRVNVLAVVGAAVTVGIPDGRGGQATVVLSPPYVSPLFPPTVGGTALLLMSGPIPQLLPSDAVVAGNVTLDQAGLAVTSIDEETLTPKDVTRFGPGGSDFLAVTDTAGAVLGAINALGGAQVTSLAVGSWPQIGSPDWTGVGGSLDKVIDRRPRGIAVIGVVNLPGPQTDTTVIGYFEASGVLYPGRQYRLSTSAFRMLSTVDGDVAEIQVRYTAVTGSGNPPQPTSTSPVMTRSVASADIIGRGGVVQRIFSPPPTITSVGRYRLLLTYNRVSGTGLVRMNANDTDEQIQMWMEDVGPVLTPLSVINNGGGAPVVLPQQQSLTVQASWVQSFDEAGTLTVLPDNGNAVQGYGSAAKGVERAMIGFRDLVELTGATIVSVTLRLYAKYWALPEGGTAVIGFHGVLNAPNVFVPATMEDQIRVSGWQEVATQYVDLTALDPQRWTTGAIRGIRLGALSVGTNPEFYGRFAGIYKAVTELRPELTFVYVK